MALDWGHPVFMRTDGGSGETRGPIWVAGATKGIGRAIADHLEGRRRCSVLRMGRSIGRDLRDPAVIHDLLEKEGAPFAWIHCIGDFMERPLLETSQQEWGKLLESNLSTFSQVAELVLPAMASRGEGRVLCFGAAGLEKGKTRAPAYFACKAALWSMTLSLAKQWGAEGLTCNMISPGLVAHEHAHRESLSRMAKKVPLGRLGTTGDLLPLVDLLLSSRGSYVTGQQIVVDGGLSL